MGSPDAIPFSFPESLKKAYINSACNDLDVMR
jgi:hypothetical protein